MLAYRVNPVSDTHLRPGPQQLLDRICVRPPYFALKQMSLDGEHFSATATAEAPPYLERGPMTAAEVGRHAAIAGLCHVALSQSDDRRRYYLAQRAECRYEPTNAPYGTAVRLQTELLSVGKREARVAIAATAANQPFAMLEVSYTILTEPTFERLFANRRHATENNANPYRQLLQTEYLRQGNTAEQLVRQVPAEACSGHFDGYPALPVAVLMGQLSYLAGQIVADPPRPFRVVRGLVEASDLGWAGEAVRFCALRTETRLSSQSFHCEAYAGGRPVGTMQLWTELVG